MLPGALSSRPAPNTNAVPPLQSPGTEPTQGSHSGEDFPSLTIKKELTWCFLPNSLWRSAAFPQAAVPASASQCTHPTYTQGSFSRPHTQTEKRLE